MKAQRFAIAALFLLPACSQSTTSQSVTASRPSEGRDSDARPVPPPPPVPEWRAFGTEPFWSVRVIGNHLVFSTPENPDGVNLTAKHSMPGGVDHFDSMDGSNSFDLDIHPEQCNDGMSDKQYELTSRFRYGAINYVGCAERLK